MVNYTIEQILYQLNSIIQFDKREKEDYLGEVPSASNKSS